MAYVRTSLALVGFGFVIARLDPHAVSSLISGMVMVAGGIAASLFGAYRYLEERRALIAHTTRTLRPSAAVVLAVATSGCGALAAFAMFRLAGH